MDEVGKLCDKVLWLVHGMSKMYGDSEAVINEYLKYVNEADVKPPVLL